MLTVHLQRLFSVQPAAVSLALLICFSVFWGYLSAYCFLFYCPQIQFAGFIEPVKVTFGAKAPNVKKKLF